MSALETDEPQQDAKDDLDDRVQRLERLTDILRENYKEERDARQHLAEELHDAHDHIDTLETELEDLRSELDDQTEIMRRAMRSSSLTATERAALLVQVMWRDAKSDPNGKATMTAKEAVDCLQRDVSRNAMYGEYGAFQKAVELVDDDDILYLVKESRASSKNTRLVLDLEGGQPPRTADGFDLTPQEAD